MNVEKENLMNKVCRCCMYNIFCLKLSIVSQSSTTTTAAAVAASVSTDTVCLVLLLCGRE